MATIPGPRAPVPIDYLVDIATEAARFFSRDRETHAALLLEVAKADPPGSLLPFTMNDFFLYLQQRGFPNAQSQGVLIERLLNRMVDARMITDHGQQPGFDIFGHRLFTDDAQLRTQSQSEGYLWLAEPLGAGLIKPAYGSVTVPIAGLSKATGDERIGSGLVLDEFHVLTNAHVVNDMTLKDEIEHSRIMPPAGPAPVREGSGVPIVSFCAHSRVDVAVITVHPAEGQPGLPVLGGVAFRPPQWPDETYVFGYPPIARTSAPHMVCERGEVVNGSISDYSTDDEFFVYSATTRPGNSGGPIVAQDGRVIGLVAHDVLAEGSSADSFYRGIPGHVIVDALTAMGFGDLVTLEDWS
ncbi:trypsin [Mycobacterium parascrofulaceum ATCC BAA-614]|uniref:Trypsin n=1 Tax=Mycobacterium parascrofulaceum ATCC BAA-614 TaxID=525368 RepID=D5P636_9MYCO|nr:serine protease [Mycobacterium parascrofulaceum]EFG78472.1 trypsin [Mycobacterium parascrofulaceum ATCC BAA-614]